MLCKNDHCAAKAVALLYSWPCWRARSPCGAPRSRSAWCVWCVCCMLSADILALTKYELKFVYCEKTTKFCEISTLLLSTGHTDKSKVEISQNFLVFSEYMNFIHSLSFIKVKTLWEGHKIGKKFPPVFTKQLFLLSSVKTSGILFQIFVAFSEKLNFTQRTQPWVLTFSHPIFNF